jgi:hypothetical protein
MSKQLHKYRVLCPTENKYYESWHESLPTQCPLGHAINPDMTTILDSVSENQVYIASKTFTTTNGYYMMKGSKISFAANEITKIIDYSFPYPICLVGFICQTTDKQTGDNINVIISPNTLVGVTTAQSESTNVIPVSDTVVANVVPGFNISINGTDVGEVISIDKTNKTITLLNTVNSVSMYSTVTVNVFVVSDFYFSGAGKYTCGYGMNGTKPIPANTIIRIIYTRAPENTSTANDIMIAYEYTY